MLHNPPPGAELGSAQCGRGGHIGAGMHHAQGHQCTMLRASYRSVPWTGASNATAVHVRYSRHACLCHARYSLRGEHMLHKPPPSVLVSCAVQPAPASELAPAPFAQPAYMRPWLTIGVGIRAFICTAIRTAICTNIRTAIVEWGPC